MRVAQESEESEESDVEPPAKKNVDGRRTSRNIHKNRNFKSSHFIYKEARKYLY